MQVDITTNSPLISDCRISFKTSQGAESPCWLFILKRMENCKYPAIKYNGKYTNQNHSCYWRCGTMQYPGAKEHNWLQATYFKDMMQYINTMISLSCCLSQQHTASSNANYILITSVTAM